MRPDVAEAFDAWRRPPAARPGPTCRSRAASAPTPSRHACSRPTPTRTGSRLPAPASTATDRARPRSARGLRLAGGERAQIRLHQELPLGAWHYGFGANPRDRAHPAQYERGSWEPPGGDHGRIHHGLPSFVPPRFHDPIARAALRWNVPMNLLAAQLYAESGFNPFATQPGRRPGHRPVHARHRARLRADNPYEPVEAIDAQAHLMSDLLRRFAASSPWRWPRTTRAGAVERYGGVPPYAETRAYVARSSGCWAGPETSRWRPSNRARRVAIASRHGDRSQSTASRSCRSWSERRSARATGARSPRR